LIRNLAVRFNNKTVISARNVHDLVAVMKKEFNFRVAFLDIIFVSSEEMIDYNCKYLKHNYSTDVISLNFSDQDLVLEGLIVISTQDAEKNAALYKVSLDEELFRLVIHGILHLLGFNDGNSSERGLMKRKENYFLRKFTKN